MKTRLGGLVEMVLQLAQRKSAQEERSPHLLPQRDGRQKDFCGKEAGHYC
jgi:hypothetical protein